MSSTPTLPVVDVWKGYDAIARWCRTNGHTLSRTRWEVYGDWDEDPASVQTAVYWVLES